MEDRCHGVYFVFHVWIGFVDVYIKLIQVLNPLFIASPTAQFCISSVEIIDQVVLLVGRRRESKSWLSVFPRRQKSC